MGDFDFNALISEIRNEAMLKLTVAMIDNPNERKTVKQLLEIFIRHGINVDTAMSIIKEINDLINKEKDDD